MSSYVFGTSLSYEDYLVGKSFVDDVTSASRDASKRVSMDISRQTREVIASNEALAKENIRVMADYSDNMAGAIDASSDRIVGALGEGFERLSYGLDNISAGISELSATFHWGFSAMLGQLGHMNDTLEELVKIAKTPVQTVAFNHFEIARDAYRQGLYKECLDELEKAISGDHASAGYKLEWRFHQMKGMIRLGFADGDMALKDHADAEDAFLLAVRYGKTDYPEDAGRAALSAGWAAYCQGKLKEALAHTELSIALHPRLGEAFFQAAKVRMALGQIDSALPVLGKAIDLDRFYTLKAAGDGDFQKYDDRLRDFLDALRKEKYRQSLPMVKAAMEDIAVLREYIQSTKTNPVISRMEAFIKAGENWPLMDMLEVVQNLDLIIAEMKTLPIVVPIKALGAIRNREEKYPVKETYQEKVVIKPGGLFRKAVTEIQTKTRTVMKTRIIEERVAGQSVPMEFCFVPPGTFLMGSPSDEKNRMDNEQQHRVTISKGFFLGKYPVTQAQWEAVMGENPSNFKEEDLPVEMVSWEDCQRFIHMFNRMGGLFTYRLPTEAEWEYACRAGSTTAYCFGDKESQLGEYAWYDGNSGRNTHFVGKKKPNAWGLYDMHGNVWEWCQDRHGDYPSGPVYDPEGLSSGNNHVMRGGSWNDIAGYCRSASRSSSPVNCYSYLGFRLACLPVTGSGK
jgi:formylglycine-generating enzyme required for sulfatase activity/tetratricopeptide (TPR) repeat protein